MSYLIAAPEMVAAAATDLAGVGSNISAANMSIAAMTTQVLPAGADEVSSAIAALFGAHGRVYQALSAQAAAFHDQIVQTLTAGANAYAGAEAANATPMQAALNAAAAAPAGPLKQLEQMHIGFNTALVKNELALNSALVTNEVAFERSIFGTDSALNGALNRTFNAGNLLIGTGEQALNTIVGVQVPANFTAGLLLGSSAQVFNGGQIGGLVGAFDQSLMVPTDLAGLFLGNTSPAAAAITNAAAATSPSGFFQQLETAQIGFNTQLVNDELNFNHNLLTHEVASEQSVFGTDSALNGVINRSYNVGNLLIGTGEQAVNTIVGAAAPASFTASLLAGSSAQSFNGGEIGGVVGAFDQSLAAGADLAGLITGQ